MRTAARLRLLLPPRQFSPFDMATIRSAKQDCEGALQWLERAVAERSVDVIWIKVDPRLDNVRAHPGFQDVSRANGAAPVNVSVSSC